MSGCIYVVVFFIGTIFILHLSFKRASWCRDLPPRLGAQTRPFNLCARKQWWGTFAFSCWLCVDFGCVGFFLNIFIKIVIEKIRYLCKCLCNKHKFNYVHANTISQLLGIKSQTLKANSFLNFFSFSTFSLNFLWNYQTFYCLAGFLRYFDKCCAPLEIHNNPARNRKKN